MLKSQAKPVNNGCVLLIITHVPWLRPQIYDVIMRSEYLIKDSSLLITVLLMETDR